jgi:hypothetical protein
MTPAVKRDTVESEVYQFACPECWAVRTVALTPGAKRPMCDCGSPLFAIAEVNGEPDDVALDHPHESPNCAFCAARQAPMQHRLWCAIYFLRNCNCGFGERP